MPIVVNQYNAHVINVGQRGAGHEKIVQGGEKIAGPILFEHRCRRQTLLRSPLQRVRRHECTGMIARAVDPVGIRGQRINTRFAVERDGLDTRVRKHTMRILLDQIHGIECRPCEQQAPRIGGHRSIKVDVRMITATNISLKQMVQENRFREDLYFRLNVIPIELPPLRNRRGDISLLANFFLDKFNLKLNQKIEGITQEAMAILENYHWPGNIRELENLIERLVVLRSNERWIDVKDLPFDLLYNENAMKSGQRVEKGLMQARRLFERQYILRALRICKYNQAKTARMLRIHRNTLIQKMKALEINSRSENNSST